MKAQTIRRIAAALAVFALVAGHAMTGSETRAEDQPFVNPLAGLSKFLLKRCEDAWHESSASQTCEFSAGGGIDFDRGNWNRCELTGVGCRMRNSNSYWFLNDWSGVIEDLRNLSNCNGLLRQGSC